jgi:protein-disulfide isomerase
MAKQEKKSSGMPVAIIVGVLVLVVLGGFLLYRSSSTPTVSQGNINKPNATPVPRPTIPWQTAPTGAQPPNAIGAPTAAVTLEEFADFQCGSCGATYPVIKDILKAYNGNPNFRFVYRNFPLQMHDKAYDAAVASEAAGLQNPAKFWLMEDQLFTNQAKWSIDQNYKDTFNDYASKIGLDVEKFKADIAGTEAKRRVELDLARGKALGIGSTPTVIINNKMIPYQEVTLAGLKRIIDAELAAVNTPPQQQPATSNAQSGLANGQSAPANK